MPARPTLRKFTIDANTGALSFITAPDYETPGSAAGSNVYTVKVQASDGAGGTDVQTIQVTVTDVAEGTSSPQLVGQTFLGGSGNQAATAVTFASSHLYLTYNNLPINSNASDSAAVVSFTTAATIAPTQDFSLAWNKGFFNGVASDGTHIYAAGGSHPTAGLTTDGVGGAEEKTMLAIFNANGIAGSNPSPATGYTHNNFFGYTGTEIFQNVVATTQSGNTVLYAVGFGQPESYGAYVIASYDSSGNLLHTATDPLAVPGFSNAYDAVEFARQDLGRRQHPAFRRRDQSRWRGLRATT